MYQRGPKNHLAIGPLFRASAAADLPTHDQVSETMFSRVVFGRHFHVRYKDEQIPVSSTGQAFDEPLYASTELGLRRRIVVGCSLWTSVPPPEGSRSDSPE